jgi:hypothetical protein
LNICNFIWGIIKGLYTYLILIVYTLQKKKKTKKNYKIKINKFFIEGLNFFQKNSASIEIVRENNIEKIRFIKLPFCKYLPK